MNDKMPSTKLAVVCGGGGEEFEAKLTSHVIVSSITAATGGLMFGYDIAIAGRVTSMASFLAGFFPEIYVKMRNHAAMETNYCKFDNQALQIFTSSLYLSALTSTFFASHTTRAHGRRATMIIAGIFFIFGALLSSAATNLFMLVLGRIFFGSGVGFAHQAVPIYISEIAPIRIRGALNVLFQLHVTVGILFGKLIYYFTSRIGGECGWRATLAIAALPAIIFTVGSILIDDTPNSLIERGHSEFGRSVLRKIRGTDNVEPEYVEIVKASRIAQEVEHPFINLLMCQNGPPLTVAIMLQIFQQFTGINAIIFYAPIIFSMLGFGNDASLYSSIVIGTVNVLSTMAAVYLVDKVGRRKLLVESGVQMFLSQMIIGLILGLKVKDNAVLTMSHGMAVFVLLMVCTFISAFAWSCGPLGWLIPSETFPLETRSVGMSVTVCVNMMFVFLIAHSFLPMLCAMKFGVFFFFSGWVAAMWLFVWFLLPETKGIPIEEMTEKVWKQHWFWKRYTEYEDEEMIF